jgi:MFS family permease
MSALVSPLGLPHFRRLWIADMISLLGDWAGRLALTVVVLERTDSPAWAAGVTAVSLAGFVGFGQVLATLADRHGRVAVMLAADVARALLFFAMLISMPVGGLLVLAFLAGLATPPFEAARSAALPDLVPEERYGEALALAGISVQSSLVLGYAVGGLLLTVVEPEAALAINAASFLVSAVVLLGLRHTAAALPAAVRTTVTRSLGDGAAALFGDRMVRRAIVIVATAGALGTVGEALVVPYAEGIGLGDGLLGLLAAVVPVGTLLGTAAISTGTRDHHTLLRNAAWCGAITAALAAPLFWFEASGALAFLAFLVAGGMFAVSIPTNQVIGMRLSRDNRASAMGIAVGVLMGSQAAGAAAGGLAASVVGPAQAIGGALTTAAVFGLWAAVTTPTEAKHMVRQRRPVRADERSVIDLTAIEARRPSAGVS